MAESTLKPGSAEVITPRIWHLTNWLERPAIRQTIVPVCLLLILLVGAFFRFTGLNWDENKHLHPDERFLTMVSTGIEWPAELTLSQYFDTSTSPLSPYNHNFSFYVYGTLPIFLVKRVAMWLDQTGYEQIYLVGRALSGLFDLGTIFCLFLVGRRLYDNRVALLGAALLSLTVLLIQHAHFFTVDTFANFFAVLTFYFAVRASQSGRWADYALMGLALGAGLACKVNLVTLGSVVALAGGLYFYCLRREGMDLFRAIEQTTVRLILAAFLILLTFRILQPISFAGPSFFNFSLNEQWLGNMREVGETLSGDRDIPPGHQWTNRPPLWFPWENMVFWGMGLPLGLAAWAGFALAAYELFRRQKLAHLLPVAYIGLTFLYQGTQWVKTLRYFLPLYPFLVLLAGYLLIWVWDWAVGQPPTDKEARNTSLLGLFRRLNARWLAAALIVIVLGATLLYAIAFTSIYRRTHSRIQASLWIYNHIPAGATLANEHWDDGLPQSFEGMIREQYQYAELPLYGDDNPEKLAQLVELLGQADYIILSSNRLYGSIPRLPLRYPMTIRYYELLFAEKLGFKKIAEFTSYPQLFGLELPDQSAEEAFTVYDHPKVVIFQKTTSFDSVQVQSLLGKDIDWAGVINTWPKQATKAPTALMLTVADRQFYQEAGTWSALFDRTGWANQFPVVVWLLVIGVIGLLAWPLTFVVFNNFVDRAYILSKALGLLLVSWIVWLLASSRLLPFDWTAISVAILILALVSALVVRGRDLTAFWRANWRLILLEEALFWGLFFFMLWIRWRNPDLWHPDRGGEKPMDFAYLNAVVKSIYFPPYDPWFAGGFINYYYFGFVLVATLIKLTGIVPAVAYNLAVPTFFAMTALGGFSVALNLTAKGRKFSTPGLIAGLLAVLFVAVIGNLGQARLLWEETQNLSQVNFETKVPGLLATAKTLDGLSEVTNKGFDWSARPEKWYWDASRMIPHPDNEAGPITEFPFFSFLFADLHAHLMALPYTLLVLALAVNLVRPKPESDPILPLTLKPETNDQTSAEPVSEVSSSSVLRIETLKDDQASAAPASEVLAHPEANLPPAPPLQPQTHGRWSQVVKKIPSLLPARHWGEIFTLCLLALAVGVLWPLNTWDFPAYATIAGLALACREYGRRQQLNLSYAWAVIWRWGLVLGLSLVFFWPFHRAYAGAYTGFEWWQGSQTPLDAYLTVYGFFLFIIVTYLVAELSSGQGFNPVVRLLRLIRQYWSRRRRFRYLYRLLVQPRPGFTLAWQSVSYALLVVVVLLVLGYGVFGLIASLMLLVILLGLNPQAEPRQQFVIGVIGIGLAMTLLIEWIVLKGDISRMNTVFKFYLQIWVMWAVMTAACLPLIAAHLRQHIKLQRLWWPVFALLLTACLLYPLLATPARINDRFKDSPGQTLDGLAYMAKAVYRDKDQDFALDWDHQGMEWLEQNVYGSPVILEANTPIYRWGNRVANYTGLPAVIGWDWHQKQQRAILPASVIERRLQDVQTIYTNPDPKTVYDLLLRYKVQYIYIGPLERLYYGPESLSKFAGSQGGYWNLVYENAEVKIYQVLYPNR